MAVVNDLQAQIEALHDVQTSLDVTAYLVDEETRCHIPGAVSGLPEQFFVRQVDDALEMALYIDPQIVQQLEAQHPHARLDADNLESYCIALEGVSHFTLVAWRASHHLQVSALEMELQAEVDKFVTGWLLMVQQGHEARPSGRALHERIFAGSMLRDEVPKDEIERYQVSSRLASAFCAKLCAHYATPFRPAQVIRDARAFYRRSFVDKLRFY